MALFDGMGIVTTTTTAPAAVPTPGIPLYPYNGTQATGGDSLTFDLNSYYQSGDMAWIIAATALVFIQTPGVGLFYAGLARRKSALSLVWMSMMTLAVVEFQWFFWGYSLSFSHDVRSGMLGTLANFGYKDTLGAPSVMSDRIPDLLMAVYQGMFACLTGAISMGAVAERGRMVPALIFLFVWATLVYAPLACWVWNPQGWLAKLGVYDFAGGTPVHINSGTTALVYSYFLGQRRGYGTHAVQYRPHNVIHIALGTIFLWFGWFGFNPGSAMSASLRAVMAAVVTTTAAGVGGMTWCLMDWRLEHKFSLVGFCSGVVAGLVCITPGSGFVPPWASVIFGVIAGAVCNYATKLKYLLRADDAMDIFAVHAIGGICGNILTALFAADYIAALDGYTQIPGGWLNGHYIQLGYHLASCVVGVVWAGGISALILLVMKYIPMLHLRVDEEDEITGLDENELGEFAYDYVEVTREVIPERSPTMDEKVEEAVKRVEHIEF